MSTGRKNEFEERLSEAMSIEELDICVPSPSDLMRQKLMARKKTENASNGFIDNIINYFRLEFRFYHMGLTALVITASIFYMNTPNYESGDASNFINEHAGLSISNNTISVNSSTMLTSIPTMVIRN